MKARYTTLAGVLSLVLAVGSGCGEAQRAPSSDTQIESSSTAAPVRSTPTATKPAEIPHPAPTEAVQTTGDETAGPAPRIEVENPEIDLGVIGPSTQHRAAFRFKNVGEGVLKITRVTSTCSCFVPDLAKKEYAPGESGTVNAVYHAGSSAGPVHKTLYIISNDPKQPSASLVITGTIRLKVVTEPASLQFTAAKENAGAVPICISCTDQTPFAIRSITASSNAVTFDYDPEKKATEFVLQPQVDPSKLEQTLNGYVRIQTTHPEVPELTIPWTAQPCITLSQPRFILQNAEPGQAVTRTVWVTNHCGGTLEITSAESTKGMMEIAGQESKDGHLKLDIRITPPARKDEVMRYISDGLTLKFADGRSATIYCTGWYKMQ